MTRDCWSAIIVDILFGGQLIHSYIKDINTSLTHPFYNCPHCFRDIRRLVFFGGLSGLGGFTGGAACVGAAFARIEVEFVAEVIT